MRAPPEIRPGTNPADLAMYPPSTPLEPVTHAPARFGKAGYSVGDHIDIKRTVTLPKMIPATKSDPRGLSTGLGWFSIALGALELASPRTLSRPLGLGPVGDNLLRVYGAREIANGLAILATPDTHARAKWVWARVAGDVLDLATLAAGLYPGNRQRDNVVAAMVAVGAVTALDIFCALGLTKAATPGAARPKKPEDDDRDLPSPYEAPSGA